MSANPPTPSPTGSLAGYKFATWLAKNKGDLKLIVAAIAGLIAFFVAKIQPPELNAAISGVVTAVVKFLADGIDYWLSDNPA